MRPMDNINVTGAYIYFKLHIFGLEINVTQTMLSVLLVSILMITASILIGKNLQKRPGKLQVLVEKGVMMMYNMVCSTMGKHNAHWTPYIGTIFLTSILGSYIGLLGFFRSSTADLSVPLVWAIMTTVIIWYNNIKNNGFVGWLKGFTEPVVVMTPMNIVSEIAQPISMAFRHFGNVAGGGVITMILYTALSLLSTMVIRLISGTAVIAIVVAVLGVAVLVWGMKTGKLLWRILGIVFVVLGILGVLQFSGVLKDVPIFQFGIPAVLSVYFDIFSGFVQAFVFSLLNMVYIAGSCPDPAEAEA